MFSTREYRKRPCLRRTATKMSYQRTEYADKTLSMNSLADRKLKIQLNSLDCHKGTIQKEMDREKKKIKKELAEAGECMRQRLSISEQSAEGKPRISPRLPRRYSTPQVLLSASLPSRTLSSELEKRSPGNRRKIGSDGMIESLGTPDCSLRSASPTSSQFLLPPFNQPRRRSLPPIGVGNSLTAPDSAAGKSPLLPRRDSNDGKRTARETVSLGPLSPRNTQRRKGSAVGESEMTVEVAAKVGIFLQKMGEGKRKDCPKQKSIPKADEELSTDDEDEETFIHPLTVEPVKRSSSFQPNRFE